MTESVTESAVRFPGSPYDGEIAYMDSQLGQLIGALVDGSRVIILVVLTQALPMVRREGDDCRAFHR